jgi:hypothetical protein
VARIRLEPFHEPIGLSPEIFSTTRRWAVAAVVLLIVLAAGVAVLLRAA